MGDPVQQAYDDVRSLVGDYFSIGDSESETVMKLAKSCAQTAGVTMAVTGGVALSGVGAVTVPLVGSVPGYLVGALAGFVGGTTACMIARRANVEHAKRILSQHGVTEQQFKSDVRRLVSLAEGRAGYCRAPV